MSDKLGPSNIVPGGVKPADDPEGACVSLVLEAEFLNCLDEAEVKNSKSLLRDLDPCKSVLEIEPIRDILLCGEAEHYVNLPRKDKYRGFYSKDDPKTADKFPVDRTTETPRILVRYMYKDGVNTGASLSRKVRVIIEPCGGDDIFYYKQEVYNPATEKFVKSEEKRLGSKVKLETVVTTNKAGYFLIDGEINIGAIAGNRYRIRAEDVSCSDELNTTSVSYLRLWRYMWIQKVQCGAGMWTHHGTHPFDRIPELEREYQKVFLRIDDSVGGIIKRKEYEFVDRGTDGKLAHWDWLSNIIKKHAMNKPYVIGMACSRTLGVVIEDKVSFMSDVQTTSAFMTIKFKGLIATYAHEAGNNKYIVKATCNGNDIRNYIEVLGMCDNGIGGSPYFIGTELEIDVAEISKQLGITGQCHFFIEVKVIDNERGVAGLYKQGTNLVWLSTEWHAKDDTHLLGKNIIDNTAGTNAIYVMVHEVGHLLGMTQDYNENAPYRHPWCYNEQLVPGEDFILKKHAGNHCKYEYRMTTAKTYDTAQYPSLVKDNLGNTYAYRQGSCVMYGQVHTYGLDFCHDCTKAIRKIKCKNGWI